MFKKVTFLILFIVFLSFLNGEIKKIDIQSKIDSVTIFKEEALIKRNSLKIFERGKYLLEFSKLPSSIIDSTIKVKGVGTAVSKILGIKIRNYYLKKSLKKNIDLFKQKLKRIKNELSLERGKEKILNSKKNFLNNIIKEMTKSLSNQKSNITYSTEKLSNILNFYESQLTLIFKKNRNIDKKILELSNKEELIKGKLNEYKYGSGKERKKVQVELEVLKSGNLNINLSYRIRDANWTSFYNLRIFSNKKKSTLDYSAIIKQKTGEDWKGVKLKLSNATTIQLDKLPSLKPLLLMELKFLHGNIFGKVKTEDGELIPGVLIVLIDTFGSKKTKISDERGNFRFISLKADSNYKIIAELEGFNTIEKSGIQISGGYNTQLDLNMMLKKLNEQIIVAGNVPVIAGSTNRSYSRKRSKSKYSEKKSYAITKKSLIIESEQRNNKEFENQIQLETANISQNTFDVSYSIKYRDTILSNYEEKKVTLSSNPISVDIERVIIPKVSTFCYINARIKKLSDKSLSGGRINVFYDGAFVNKTRIKTKYINQKIDIPIAIDRSVKIKRTVKNTQMGKKGFIKKRRILDQGYIITISNYDKKDKILKIFDRIPVSRSKKIEIKEINIIPKPEKIEKNGIIKWEIYLKPGKEKKITVNYKVSYPKDIRITQN